LAAAAPTLVWVVAECAREFLRGGVPRPIGGGHRELAERCGEARVRERLPEMVMGAAHGRWTRRREIRVRMWRSRTEQI
jgi:hypothetical protein